MSDEFLRKLERSFSQSRALEDEIAYLSEKTRTGELGREKLELAAHCGNPAAMVVSGGSKAETIDGLLAELTVWDRLALTRLALAAAESISRYVDVDAWTHGELAKAREWLRCPCDDHVQEVLAARERNIEAWDGDLSPSKRSSEAWFSLRAARTVIGNVSYVITAQDGAEAKAGCRSALDIWTIWSKRSGRNDLGWEAIASTVAQWALGYESLPDSHQ